MAATEARVVLEERLLGEPVDAGVDHGVVVVSLRHRVGPLELPVLRRGEEDVVERLGAPVAHALGLGEDVGQGAVLEALRP